MPGSSRAMLGPNGPLDGEHTAHYTSSQDRAIARIVRDRAGAIEVNARPGPSNHRKGSVISEDYTPHDRHYKDPTRSSGRRIKAESQAYNNRQHKTSVRTAARPTNPQTADIEKLTASNALPYQCSVDQPGRTAHSWTDSRISRATTRTHALRSNGLSSTDGAGDLNHSLTPIHITSSD